MYISNISTKAPEDERIPLETEVYALLDRLKISYERVDNDSISSMEDCKEISDVLGVEIRKSVFLCNQKKTVFYLLVMPADKQFNTSAFCKKLECSRVSFGSGELMQKYLGVTPGSATIMGLLNDKDNAVKLIIDKEVADAEWFGCNPGINTSHIKIKAKQLFEDLLPYIKHEAKIIEL